MGRNKGGVRRNGNAIWRWEHAGALVLSEHGNPLWNPHI